MGVGVAADVGSVVAKAVAGTALLAGRVVAPGDPEHAATKRLETNSAVCATARGLMPSTIRDRTPTKKGESVHTAASAADFRLSAKTLNDSVRSGIAFVKIGASTPE